jgi:cytoskeleton protein RodZ
MSEADHPPEKAGAKPQRDDAPSASAASPIAEKPSQPSLGAFLAAARERRGVTRDDVVKETRIPAHYIGMIESDNYSAISDQLYLLPFIRRYADFLGLDSDAIAVRFVREVQRVESSVVRMSQPIVDRRQRRGHLRIWAFIALVIALMAGALYLRNRRLSASLQLESPVTVAPAPAAAFGEKAGAPITLAPPPISTAPSRTDPARPSVPPLSTRDAPGPATAPR